MKKIAFINQRYGLEVNGGSEYYTRLMAEKLSNKYHVTVLTSKALSYKTWTNYYSDDIEKINNVDVIRFTCKHERKQLFMRMLSKIIERFHVNSMFLCKLWVKAQGPYIPDIVTYLQDHKKDYDVFIFVTYLYYPTVMGLPEVKNKAIFIPTAHDEVYMRYATHQRLFHMPKVIVYLTEEEKNLVSAIHHNEHIPSITAGVGIDTPEHTDADRFKEKYNIKSKYIIYAGRIDESKGCGEMFDMFLKYYQTRKDIQLVLIGKDIMDIPEHESIRYIGFVSEEDKFDGISGAEVLWLPSHLESLSIAVLEAMSLSVPVLVNGGCDVLVGHCRKSGGGLYYTDYDSMCKSLDNLLYSTERDTYRQCAKQYVEKNYSWDKIIRDFNNIIDDIS